jgi:hypothetical protein
VARTRRSSGKRRAAGSTSSTPAGYNGGAAPGGLLVAEIRTKAQDHEWQIMEAFIGYLDRHLGEQIDSIWIYYR